MCVCMDYFNHLCASMTVSYYLSIAYSEMPAFLVNEGGLNSGFMIAHCTSAALGKDVTTP